MKIGIDCRLWNETGVGRYTRNLVRQLQILDKKNEYVLFVLPKDREYINAQLSNNNFRLIPVDIRWHSVKEQITFPQILNKEKLDLMHFPYFSVPIFYKRPFVITVHDLIIHYFGTGKASTLPQPMYHFKRAGYKHVLSQAVKNAQKIIVPLDTVKEDVLETLNVPEDKVVVTYEGVDEGLNGKGESKKGKNTSPYFLYVGNAYPHKNLERLIAAFVEFKKRTEEDIQLLLVGKDDYFYKRLKEKVTDEHIEGILFHHDVSDQELVALYTNARALISSSLMEGFGLPPLEAMAVGCPVLLSDIPSFREVCRDAAFYCNPYSVDAIREKMEYVSGITDKTRQEHIKRGLERVQEFSWKKMAEQTLDVYEKTSV